MDCSTPRFPVHHHLLEFAQAHAASVSDGVHPSAPLSPLILRPSVFPSIRVFSNESVLRIRWPKYWRFSFSVSPSNEYSGLISLMIDWFDLLAIQGTLKSLLQHHSSKVSILRHSELEHVCFQTSHMISIKNTFYGNRICLWWFETAGIYFLT